MAAKIVDQTEQKTPVTKETLYPYIKRIMEKVNKQLESRPILERGQRYRRTEVDQLKDLKLWNAQAIKDELDKIAEKRSTLSSGQRTFIKNLFADAVRMYIIEHPKDKEEKKDEGTM